MAPLRPTLTTAAAAALALALAAAGCGSSDDSSSSGGGGAYGGGAPAKTSSNASSSPAAAPAGTIKLGADPSGALKFTRTALTAKAGKVTIAMTNPSSTPHSIAIEGNGVDEDAPQTSVMNGQTATVSASLKPGRYTFYCPVDGHEAAGMKGTLVVK